MFFFHFDVVLVVKLFFPVVRRNNTQYILCSVCSVKRRHTERAHLLFFHFRWVAVSDASFCAYVLNVPLFPFFPRSEPRKIEELCRRFSLFACSVCCVCVCARGYSTLFSSDRSTQCRHILIKFYYHFYCILFHRFLLVSLHVSFPFNFCTRAIVAAAAAASMQFTVEK